MKLRAEALPEGNQESEANRGLSDLVGAPTILLNWLHYGDIQTRRCRNLPASRVDSSDQSDDLAPFVGAQ